MTYYHCPVCGKSFRYAAKNAEQRDAQFIKWAQHVLDCKAYAWTPQWTNEPWEESFWQAKRLVLIRDSVSNELFDDNPWTRRPKCQGCGWVNEKASVSSALRGWSNGIEIQHILPRSQGGSNHPANLAVLCRRCHIRTFKHEYRGVPGNRGSRQETIADYYRGRELLRGAR